MPYPEHITRTVSAIRNCAKYVLLAVGSCLLSVNVSAEIYKWIDENGIIHYSEVAPSENVHSLKNPELPTLNISEPVNLDKYKLIIDDLTQGEYPSSKSSFTGRLLFDGHPISVSNPDEVRTWIRDESTGKGTQHKAFFDPVNNTIVARNLPKGTYGISVNVDRNKSNPKLYPGDYRKWVIFKIRKRNSIRIDIDLEEIIHMTQPENNNGKLRNFLDYCKKPTTFESPVTFRWIPVIPQSTYTYTIQKYTCHPLNFEGVVADGITLNTFVSLNLPKAPANGFYMLLLEARSKNRLVGSLMTHGEKGYGWDYRFTVR